MAFSCTIALYFVSVIWDFIISPQEDKETQQRLRLIWLSLYSWGTGGCESKNVFGSWTTPPLIVNEEAHCHWVVGKISNYTKVQISEEPTHPLKEWSLGFLFHNWPDYLAFDCQMHLINLPARRFSGCVIKWESGLQNREEMYIGAFYNWSHHSVRAKPDRENQIHVTFSITGKPNPSGGSCIMDMHILRENKSICC